MKGRIGLRITSSILFIFSFILFLSGCALQRQSMHTLEKYYDDIPLPESHPLALEKKRRKAQVSSTPKNSGSEEGKEVYGNNQRILSPSASKQRYLPPARGYRPENHDEILRIQIEREKEKFRSVGYVQIVTSFEEVCNAVLVFNDLDRVGSKAARILVYPESWDMQLEISESQQREALRILAVQEKTLNRSKLKRKQKKGWFGSKSVEENRGSAAANPLDPPPVEREAGQTPSGYHTARRLLHLAGIKHSVRLLPLPDTEVSPLAMFNLTDYKRLLYLRHPGIVMKNMDDMLLHAPVATVAAPRGQGGGLSENFMMVMPAEEEARYIQSQVGDTTTNERAIAGLLERLYGETIMIMPRWPNEVAISDLFGISMGTQARQSAWSASKVLSEASFVLFDGGRKDKSGGWEQVPQPWQLKSLEDNISPDCHMVKEADGERWDCTEKKVWKTLYEGYRQRRMEVCGLDLEA